MIFSVSELLSIFVKFSLIALPRIFLTVNNLSETAYFDFHCILLLCGPLVMGHSVFIYSDTELSVLLDIISDAVFLRLFSCSQSTFKL